MFNTSLRYNFDSRQAVIPGQQPAIRQQGFGGHFKDAPPPFITEDKDIYNISFIIFYNNIYIINQ